MPSEISRYIIEDELGRGSFGIVYLAYDTDLDRQVAIKLFAHDPGVGLSPVRELHALAKLDHPGIVSIFDSGEFEGRPYFVSKYISGPTLTACLRNRTFTPEQAADLVAQICDAVDHAHSRGIILRDLKPSNIILEAGVRPILIDFGIALFEKDFGIDPLRSAGTLAYMCPEQANGSGHLLDPRSDVYSLGAILYELLSGGVPFDGNTQTTVTKIRQDEPARPSLRDHNIPDGLEQICTKALAKLPNSRHASAAEMAAALRSPKLGLAEPHPPGERKFAPKGLRAFDGGDADVFLDLLPGPIAASGLPESVDFWISRIGPRSKPHHPRPRFSVGVIHGLSGSGKSSLLHAGIIPRLDPSVAVASTEAASGPIEHRLLSSLRNFYPEIDPQLDLAAGIRLIKERDDAQPILIAIDQFEQWLRDWNGSHGNQLVRALRQCDGSLVQCVLVVRDDFWTSMCQFMEAIGCELHQNHNTRSVELFESSHAEVILTKVGKALGALAEEPDENQREFIKRAIAALAQESEGKASPVQIALLAEVFRNRPWDPHELKTIGGARAIGPLFLDQSFLHRSAPARNRYHASAAAKVLECLLPATGLEIRSSAKRVSELCEASGYANDAQAFCHLLQILDSELRLITPAETGESEDAPRYQLTHDYLVPSIHDWLAQQRSDTQRGRAQLRLEQLSAAYTADQDRRHLPGLLDYLRILALTNRRRWTETQRIVMHKAGVRAAGITSLIAIAAVGLTVLGLQSRSRAQVQEWLAELRAARTENIGPLLAQQFPSGRLDPIQVRSLFERAEIGSETRFNLGLALIKLEPSRRLASELFEQLFVSEPHEFAVACPILLAHDPEFDARVQRRAEGPATLPALVTSGAELDLASSRAALECFLDQGAGEIAGWVRAIPRSPGLIQLLGEYESLPPAGEFDAVKERRMAKCVLSRTLLGERSAIPECLGQTGIPVRQAYLINAIWPSGIPEADLLTQLEQPGTPPRVVAALLLALEDYTPTGEAPSKDLRAAAEKIYANAPDAYPHAAAEMLMHSWGLRISGFEPGERPLPEAGDPREWFYAKNGSKLVIIDPVPDGEVPYSFAIGAQPVLYDQYKELGPKVQGIRGHEGEAIPVHDISLLHVLRYCNALSKLEGLEPCYDIRSDRPNDVFPFPDYLERTGYRVPTGPEMLLASRGSHHLNCPVPAEFVDLIDRYEWTRQNSGRRYHRPGLLRPNAFGLSDTLAHMSEWLLNPMDLAPDLELEDRVIEFGRHVYVLGANIDSVPSVVRVGSFYRADPKSQNPTATFRLVRSLPSRALPNRDE